MKIPEIYEGKTDEVECHGEASFVVKLSSDSPKFIFPGEASFALVSESVSLLIKEAFASSLGVFSVPDILFYIGFKPGVPHQFSIFSAVKTCIKIKQGVFKEHYIRVGTNCLQIL